MQLFLMIILLAVTVFIHSSWMLLVIKYIKLNQNNMSHLMLRIVFIVCTMLCVHILEASVFAAAYMWVGAFTDWDVSFYFSIVSYATVGYGDVTLPAQWHLLGAAEGLVGALMVGWSVAVLVAILQRLKFLFEK